jgi:hypothetical protein
MTCFTAGITAHLPCAAAATAATAAADLAPEAWAFKLTPSVYATDHEHNAVDLNLRANHGPHALWVGQYQRGDEFQQTRMGYEYTANYDWGQVVPSLQAATGGFAGGSLTVQIGHPVFAIVGWGRTNLRDYYNLNFDPNDMVTLGLGARLEGGHQLSLFMVKDNRLATDQVIMHGVWRWQANEADRWTLDLAHKQGRSSPEAQRIAGESLSLTFDHRRVFVHAAYDQKVNFSANNQTRISVGLRF